MKTIQISEVGIVNVEAGNRVFIKMPSNIYGCKLGDDVRIGPFVEIQSDVTIGDGTKIQSHAFICSLVTIGKNCFIGHGAKFTNDTFSIGGPAKGNKDLWKHTTIGNNVAIGTNATILPVSIASDIIIGAGAVVTKNLTEKGIYAGVPARLIAKLD